MRPRLLSPFLFVVFLLSVLALLSVGAVPQVAITTHHFDQARTGANVNETVLTPANVNSSQFGKLFSRPVDGQVYAQPLYVPGLSINGATHNVVFVATEHDSVYAFDADGNGTSPLWQVSLLPSGASPAQSGDYEGIAPEIGVTATPVIDQSTGTIYVTAETLENGIDTFRLHALSITTGAEKFGGPVLINPTVQGTGFGSNNGVISVEPGCYARAGLALLNNVVYVTLGHCSHGWVIGYSAGTLAQVSVFNSSPNGKGASIWMGGGAPAIDSSGSLYIETGTDTDSTPGSGYQNSFVKLSSNLSALDFFEPSNSNFLLTNDADLGSGSPIVMPDNSSSHPHELIGAGKDGRIFVLNRDTGSMGQFGSMDLAIQEVQSGVQQFDNFFDTPAYWNGNLYYHSENDVLRQFSWSTSTGLLSNSPTHIAQTARFGMHGATPVVSANGSTNGIVWEVDSGAQPNGPAVLHAYDATNVSTELYNTSQVASDFAGPAVKFTVPAVVNGKVYVGTGNEVDVYGLFNQPPFGWIDSAVSGSDGSTSVPQNGTLRASGWAADQEDGAPVTRVQVRIDGTVVGNATLGISRPDVASPFNDPRYTYSGWSFSYNIGTLALGTHTVTAVAFDSTGASNVLRGSKTISVTTATNTAPFGWIDSAVNASDNSSTIAQNGTLAASGWAADQEDGSPVARVELRIDGATVGTATLGFSRPDVANAYGGNRYANSGWSFSYNIGMLALGTHTVTAVAFDSAGASTVLRGSQTITVSNSVSNTAPFGWIDNALNAADRSSTIPQNGTMVGSGWAADQQDGSPVARVQVLIDGTPVLNAGLGGSRPDVASAYNDPRYTDSGWNFTYNIGTLAAGTHIVSAVAFDSSGASNTLRGSKTITVTSGTAAPTVQLSANPSTITVGQSSTLTWSSINATSVTISGMGTFGPSGTTTVAPSSSTTYTATATGSGGSATASATVTVQSSQTCTPAPNSVTVCSPTAGSTVSSPVTFIAAANASSGIDAMAIYVDDQLAYGPVNGSSIKTSLNIAPGSHNIVVQAWVTAATETVIKKSLTINVTQ